MKRIENSIIAAVRSDPTDNTSSLGQASDGSAFLDFGLSHPFAPRTPGNAPVPMMPTYTNMPSFLLVYFVRTKNPLFSIVNTELDVRF